MGGVLEGLKDGEDSGVAVAGPVGGHQTVGLGLAVGAVVAGPLGAVEGPVGEVEVGLSGSR